MTDLLMSFVKRSCERTGVKEQLKQVKQERADRYYYPADGNAWAIAGEKC